MSAFVFDGRDLEFEQGQSIAGALVHDGVYSWRTTRQGGSPRGLFCGIGVCFDCLITIDGEPNQRACLVVAQPGLVVSSQVGTGRDDRAG